MPKNWTHERTIFLRSRPLRDGDRHHSVPRRKLWSHCPRDPSIASRFPAVRINPDVSPDLERVIDKCLEKDRNLRYQHASDIRTDLQRLKRDTDTGKDRVLALLLHLRRGVMPGSYGL